MCHFQPHGILTVNKLDDANATIVLNRLRAKHLRHHRAVETDGMGILSPPKTFERVNSTGTYNHW